MYYSDAIYMNNAYPVFSYPIFVFTTQINFTSSSGIVGLGPGSPYVADLMNRGYISETIVGILMGN